MNLIQYSKGKFTNVDKLASIVITDDHEIICYENNDDYFFVAPEFFSKFLNHLQAVNQSVENIESAVLSIIKNKEDSDE